MTNADQSRLLFALIVGLMLTLLLGAVALCLFASNSKFLVLPNIGRPKEKVSMEKTFYDGGRVPVGVVTLGRESAHWGNKESRRARLGVGAPGNSIARSSGVHVPSAGLGHSTARLFAGRAVTAHAEVHA